MEQTKSGLHAYNPTQLDMLEVCVCVVLLVCFFLAADVACGWLITTVLFLRYRGATLVW